jgi:putative ABC transport system permease protein
MGASAGRLVRQLLTESLLLAFIAGALSLLAVQFINEILTRFTLPSGMSLRALDLMPGRPLVLFASLASLVTGLLFGLAPALQSVRVDLMDDLRGAGSGSKPARRRGGPLLVTQVGLSVVLLAGAGLFTRSLQRALSLDPGFRTNHVATLEPDLELAGYTAERVVGFHDEASRRLATLPGVRAVTWTSALPLMDAIIQQSIVVPGYAQAPGEMPMATFQVVGPGYAKLLGIPILRGREFAPQDQEGSESVAIVNESLARRYFGGRNPLGGRIDVYGRTRRVVGIMKDVQMHNLTDAPSPTILIPYGQTSDYWTLVGMKALVQTSGDPAHLAGALRAQLAWLDPGVPLQSVGTLQDRLMALLAPQRMAASLMGWLSALALIIVAVGVYGAAAYEVTRRTREIGIRVALGATSSSLLRLVLGRNLGFLALGIILGAPLAVALGSVASSFLYGIAATDSITYAATALVLLSAGGLASYLPARRAARVDPMVALRCE